MIQTFALIPTDDLIALNLHLQLSKLRETPQAAEQSREVNSASPMLHCIGTI